MLLIINVNVINSIIAIKRLLFKFKSRLKRVFVEKRRTRCLSAHPHPPERSCGSVFLFAAQVRGYDTIFLFTLVATVTFNPSASDLLVFLSSSFLDL